jgi:hypothetical protein
VNLQENAELIQRYLIHLRLRKEESDRNYIPTPWEELSEEEQLLLATYHAHIHQEEDLDQQIKFRSFLRDIREKNSQLRCKRYLEKSENFFRSNSLIPFFYLLKPLPLFQCLLSRQALLGKKELAQLRP